MVAESFLLIIFFTGREKCVYNFSGPDGAFPVDNLIAVYDTAFGPVQVTVTANSSVCGRRFIFVNSVCYGR